MVAIGGHYGITIATCVPADPESKGGSEATVRVAKADLVPADANLRGDYTSWAELVDACDAWMAEVNGREHRVTRRARLGRSGGVRNRRARPRPSSSPSETAPAPGSLKQLLRARPA